jgi:hypothetical protein
MTDDLPPIPADAPRPGSLWQHYKTSKHYVVLRLTRHAGTKGILVEYTPYAETYLLQNQQPIPWSRPIEEWHEQVVIQLMDGTSTLVPRFAPVGWAAPT